MKLEGFDKYYEAPEPGRRERAYGWATAIGLQDVDGLRPSQYLIDTAKRNIEGEISADEARRLVDEYYATKLGHDEPGERTGLTEVDGDMPVAKRRSVRVMSRVSCSIMTWYPAFFFPMMPL